MKSIRLTKRTGKDGKLHIEAPGCIINIRCNLHDKDGREVTSVEIICDQYRGEPTWSINGEGEDYNTHNVRIVREWVK